MAIKNSLYESSKYGYAKGVEPQIEMRFIIYTLTLLSVIFMPVTSSIVQAATYQSQSINELQAEKERLKQIAEDKREEAAEEADVAAAAKKKIKQLEADISSAQQKINQTAQTIGETEGSITTLNGEITTREDSIAKKADQMEATLRRFFKQQLARDKIGYVGIAFSQDGISKQIQEYQNYSSLKKELERQRKELQAEKLALEEDKKEMEAKKLALQGYLTQQEIQRQSLASQEQQQAALKLDAEKAYAQLKQEEKDLMNQEARIEAIIVQKIQEQLKSRRTGSVKESGGAGTPVGQGTVIGHLGSTGFSTGPHVHFTVFTPEGATVNPRTRLGSQYIWPVDDFRVSQEYGPAGWRNPVYSFHNGIDLAGPAGQPVFAAAAGKVILDQYYGGYGYAVVIEHDDGWLTLYGHMTGK